MSTTEQQLNLVESGTTENSASTEARTVPEDTVVAVPEEPNTMPVSAEVTVREELVVIPNTTGVASPVEPIVIPDNAGVHIPEESIAIKTESMETQGTQDSTQDTDGIPEELLLANL